MALEGIYRKYILSCPQCGCHESLIEYEPCPLRPLRHIKWFEKKKLQSKHELLNLFAHAGVVCAKKNSCLAGTRWNRQPIIYMSLMHRKISFRACGCYFWRGNCVSLYWAQNERIIMGLISSCFNVFFSFVSGKWPLVLQNLSQFGLVSEYCRHFCNVCVMTS